MEEEIAKDIYQKISLIHSDDKRRNTFHDFITVMILKCKGLISQDMMTTFDDCLEHYNLDEILILGECAGKVQLCSCKSQVLLQVNKMLNEKDKFYRVNEKLIIGFFE